MLFAVIRAISRRGLGKVLTLKDTAKDWSAHGEDRSRLVGREGVSLTVLRPAGTAVFDDKRLDVVTEGEFLPAGVPVQDRPGRRDPHRGPGRREIVLMCEEVHEEVCPCLNSVISIPTFLVLLLLVLFFSFVPVGLWISAAAADVRVGIFYMIGMKLRRVPPHRIVNALIKAEKAGLEISIDKLEAHYLAGGNVTG